MLCLCRRFVCWLVVILASAALWPAAAGESFPFGSELMLDAAPMQGSKRIPMLEIEDDGTASIDLWCTSLHAQATIANDSITIVPGQPASSFPDSPRPTMPKPNAIRTGKPATPRFSPSLVKSPSGGEAATSSNCQAAPRCVSG